MWCEKGSFVVVKIMVSVRVRNFSEFFCPDNISDRLNLVWWCIIMSQSIIREYYFAIFKVKATIVCACKRCLHNMWDRLLINCDGLVTLERKKEISLWYIYIYILEINLQKKRKLRQRNVCLFVLQRRNLKQNRERGRKVQTICT